MTKMKMTCKKACIREFICVSDSLSVCYQRRGRFLFMAGNNNNEKVFSNKRVCIIGAGISGLAAAKHLSEWNIRPVVFELKDGVGGVWRETFSSTKIQSPRLAYQYSDFPWPSNVTTEHPTHSEVLNYLESYAQHFGLLDFIQFNCKVVKVEYIGKLNESTLESAGLWGKDGSAFGSDAAWKIGVQKVGGISDDIEWHDFDFLVLCIGKYGDLPKMPSFPPNKGPEVFRGKVIHTMDYAKLEEKDAYDVIKGKKTVVIGMQKSAMDTAVECAEANPDGPPCTMVFRSVHWKLPGFFIWGVFLGNIHDSRVAQFIIGKPGNGFFNDLLWRLLTPARWAISKFVELNLLCTQPLRKYGLIPKHSFLEDVSSCQITIVPEKFFPVVDKGQIQLRKSSSWCFSPNGVLLDDGTELEADLVLMGTGFDIDKKLKCLLPEPFGSVLEKTDDFVPLYRGIIHPHIPHMAILGYSESLANVFSSEMGGRWLAYFLSGKFKLPNVKEMENDIESYTRLLKRLSRFYWKFSHSSIHIWQNDDICRDMGWNPYRKHNIFSELFSPYGNHDYQGR